MSGHNNHQVAMHQEYLGTQMQAQQQQQQFSSQSPNTYGSSIPMSSVIQHRMSGSSNGPVSAHNPLPSPHQRLGPSPSSCAVNANNQQNNFYHQTANTGHPTSHTPIPLPTPTPTPSATPTMQQMNNNNTTGSGPGVGNGPPGCSLSKLQQLTNDLDQPGAPGSVATVSSMTPPPNHAHPHSTMTPPPSHLIQQNRNLPTPPTSAATFQSQMSALPYKYYPGNMNVAPPIGSAGAGQNSGSAGRTARNTASAPLQHMPGVAGMNSNPNRGSPNVSALSPNLMSPYGPLNGSLNSYRMAAAAAGQQSAAAGYISNSAAAAAAAGFINNGGQLPVQMGVMNMQSQYQDPAALQRAAAAQQSSMYSSYPYPSIPLNGTMRR